MIGIVTVLITLVTKSHDPLSRNLITQESQKSNPAELQGPYEEPQASARCLTSTRPYLEVRG